MPVTCSCCGRTIDGLPAVVTSKPYSWYTIPESERNQRAVWSDDDCVIDDEEFFVRTTLIIPIVDSEETLEYGTWSSLSEESYLAWRACFHEQHRSHLGTFFSWFVSLLPGFDDTLNLKSRIHLQDEGIRPHVELEPTDHPLAVAQRAGVTLHRAIELIEAAGIEI